MRICSIDIGKINFALCVEEIDEKELGNIINIPLKDRYTISGTPTEKFQEILTTVYKTGKLIFLENCNISSEFSKKNYFDKEIFYNLTDLFDKHSSILDTCDIFVIEQQMGFGKGKTNTLALKIAQHAFSYFAIVYGREKVIIDFPAYYKTIVLGAEKEEKKTLKGVKYTNISKPKRKKWSVVMARKILETRQDGFLENFEKNKKKDDVADVICQLQAFKFLNFCCKGEKIKF